MKIQKQIQSTVKWLKPGMGVKRWLLLLTVGVAFISLGVSALFRELYPLPNLFYYATLQFIPRMPRAALLGLTGIGAVMGALIGLNRTLLSPFIEMDTEQIVDAIERHRRRERGPRVVAIGGGHGLSVLLRGLKRQTANITAIVTVADDGGSSGRLRRELGVLPPGDLRNCIAALADDEALMTQLFQYRFGHVSGLNGHSFGNLFITAMAEVTGSFERAILESSRVLAVQGRVVPSTLRNVTLMADLREERARLNQIAGESSIAEAPGEIERVYLNPENAPAYPDAVRAILEADLIVAGPGSLYTSILPNLLVLDIAQAVTASRAKKVYVCNVATQRGETEGFNVGDHVAALERHLGEGYFPLVIANENSQVAFDPPEGVELVSVGYPDDAAYLVITADLVDPSHPWRHDSEKLSRELMGLLKE